MIGKLVMGKGGEVGIVTRLDQGWLVLDDDMTRLFLPVDVVEIDADTDPRTLKHLARQMGVDPLKAHRIPNIVQEYERKLGRIIKMEAQAHEPLK